MSISNKAINTIISQREPLSRYAQKIYDTVKDAGGFIKAWNMTFSRAIGLSSSGQADFLRYIDECIEKDYIRVMFADGKNKNGFFTLEYFCLEVLPRLRERSPEVYLAHIGYIEQKLEVIQSEKEIL